MARIPGRRRKRRLPPSNLPSQQWQEARPLGEPDVSNPAVGEGADPFMLLPVLLFALSVAMLCVGTVLGEGFVLGGAVVLFVVSVFSVMAVPLLRMLRDQQPTRGRRPR